MIEYSQLRKEILQYLSTLQDSGFSYQAICDFINSRQTDFVLFRDFFSRFRSKPNYFRSAAKAKKLSLIHQHLQQFQVQHIEEKQVVNEVLKKIIQAAAGARFEAYLEVNRFPDGSSRLKEYYQENGPAHLSLQNRIKHKAQYQWELDILNFGSTYKVLSVQTEHLFQQNALIRTQEFWKLCWVDKISKKLQFRWESLGPQTYLLAKDEQGRWRIVENILHPQPGKIEPEYIDYQHLARLKSNDWEENKDIISNFLMNEALLSCIAFTQLCYAGALLPNQSALLNRMRESCLNSYRLLNTYTINFAVFRSELDLLKKQLKLIIDGIFLHRR